MSFIIIIDSEVHDHAQCPFFYPRIYSSVVEYLEILINKTGAFIAIKFKTYKSY